MNKSAGLNKRKSVSFGIDNSQFTAESNIEKHDSDGEYDSEDEAEQRDILIVTKEEEV
jgi:hypothetical protein